MLHRIGAAGVGLLVAYMAIRAFREAPRLRPAAAVTLALLALQVAAGLAVALRPSAAADGVHVALASAVWLATVTLAGLALPRPTVEPALSPSALALERRPA